MAKQIVFLRYNFMFDAVETWQHLAQFESDLADFFTAHGLEARIVKTLEGQIGDRIMLITKVAEGLEADKSSEKEIQQKVDIQKARSKVTRLPKQAVYSDKVEREKPRIRLAYRKGRRLSQKVENVDKLGGRR